jgi:hypothetical protein
MLPITLLCGLRRLYLLKHPTLLRLFSLQLFAFLHPPQFPEWPHSLPIGVILKPIDLGTFVPLDHHQARALFQLPQGRPLVLFGALGRAA